MNACLTSCLFVITSDCFTSVKGVCSSELLEQNCVYREMKEIVQTICLCKVLNRTLGNLSLDSMTTHSVLR